jgi:hypothetical protein
MILYHYCSTSAFFEIIRNQTIWLSSLTRSNDALEGRWLAHVFEQAAKEANIAPFDVTQLLSKVRVIEDHVDCLGFCMSEKPDLLSQWRGYADDGAGFSIGLSDEFTQGAEKEDRFNSLQRVIYDREEQLNIVRPRMAEIKSFIDEGAFRKASFGSMLYPISEEEAEKQDEKFKAKSNQLFQLLTSFLGKFFALKSSAFSEEAEWRFARVLVKPLDNLEFRVRNGEIIPYWPMKITDKGKSILHVVIGPKNNTPRDTVIGFLAKYGFDDVDVTQSVASYR